MRPLMKRLRGLSKVDDAKAHVQAETDFAEVS